MHTLPSVTALRERLATVARAHPSPVNPEHQRALQSQVYAVVDELKEAGWPPERVIIAVKQIVADAGLRPSGAVVQRAGALTNGDAIVLDVVRWSIDRYYGADDRGE